MIKASSLFYAIVISIIIAIVTSSLILFSYLTRIEFDNLEIQNRVNLNAQSGLNLLLSKQSTVTLNQTKSIDLYYTGMDSVELTRKAWGAFEIIISKATFKKTTVTRIAQIGYYPDEKKAYSLYLPDSDKPIALCGETKIKGVAYLPKAGVKRAYIEGQNFIGDKLIDGEIKNSEKILPPFNKDFIKAVQSVFKNNYINENDSVITIENELSVDTLINSFKNRTIVLKNAGAINISKGYYSGNIAIISNSKIAISANAFLDNILLFAPKITISEDFKGNLQAFATDSLLLNKNVNLTYPSVLGLIQNTTSPNVGIILTNENDTIAGSMFAIKKENEIMKQVGISISKKTYITGQIYSNGYVDMKGAIYGSLMSAKIILRTPSSVYENHLLNTVIDFEKRSKFYVGINLVEESQAKKIVKWLN